MIDVTEFVTPDTADNGFGHWLVESELNGYEVGSSIDELREQISDSYQAFAVSTKVADEAVAKDVHRQQSDEDHHFSDNLEKSVRSPWLRAELARYATPGVLTALVATEGKDYALPDELFINIMQAHNYYLAQRSRELRPQFDMLVDAFESRILSLVEQNILPDSVTKRLYTLNSVRFSVGDNYGDQENDLGSCVYGEDFEDIDDVIISLPETSDAAISKPTVFHELIHVIAGGQGADNLYKLLSRSLVDPGDAVFGSKGLNEALAEHVTQVLLGNRSIEDTILGTTDEIYAEERTFLLALKTVSNGEFSMYDLVDQYFTHTPGSQTEVQLRELSGKPDAIQPNHYYDTNR